MVSSRYIPVKIKEILIRQAGNKCANPGCPNTLGEFHHIKEWWAYQAHDSQTMIVLCPICHSQVHRGELKINDATLYKWKSIIRDSNLPTVNHLYVEPHDPQKLLLGSICVTGKEGVSVFDLSHNNKLSFQVKDNDICLLNITIADLHGRKIVHIVDGHVKKDMEKDIIYRNRQGKISIITSNKSRFIPEWLFQGILKYDPSFVDKIVYTLLDIEVMEPGLVRVEGLWVTFHYGIVINSNMIMFIPKSGKIIALEGSGHETILNWSGPINQSLFGFSN